MEKHQVAYLKPNTVLPQHKITLPSLLCKCCLDVVVGWLVILTKEKGKRSDYRHSCQDNTYDGTRWSP